MPAVHGHPETQSSETRDLHARRLDKETCHLGSCGMRAGG